MRVRAFLHTIGFRYLLFVTAVFVSVRYGIIRPVFEASGLTDPLRWWEWAMLLGATLVVAMGGSIIRAFVSLREDRGQPSAFAQRGRERSRRWEQWWILVLMLLAYLLALYPSIVTERTLYAFVFPAATGLLWYYATVYRNQFLVGNVLLMLLAFALPFVVMAYEVQAVNVAYWQAVALERLSIYGLWSDTLVLAGQIAILVLSYTLVRDCRSFVTSEARGAETLPVRWGLRPTKLVVACTLFVLQLFIVAKPLLFFLRYTHSPFVWYRLGFVLLFIILPLFASSFNLLSAEKGGQFRLSMDLIIVATWGGVLLSLLRYLPIY